MKLLNLLLSFSHFAWLYDGKVHLFFGSTKVFIVYDVVIKNNFTYFVFCIFLRVVKTSFTGFLLLKGCNSCNSFGLLKIKLNKSFYLILTALQIPKIKLKTSWYNTKHLLLILLAVTL